MGQEFLPLDIIQDNNQIKNRVVKVLGGIRRGEPSYMVSGAKIQYT
jgi:hypothetical protein